MKKILSVVLFFLISISFIFAESVIGYFPSFTEDERSILLSGEILKGTSVSDDIMSFIPSGSIITDTANEVLSYDKGFVVAVDMLIPYPDKMKEMNVQISIIYTVNPSTKKKKILRLKWHYTQN